MKQTMGRLSGKMAAFFSMLINTAKNQADHKKLTQHILLLNKKHSLAEIINEAALCLKNIMDYRLFAFVIKREKGLDIWLDPRVFKKSIEKVILSDFKLRDTGLLNYLNQGFSDDKSLPLVDLKDLMYFETKEDHLSFRLYMLAPEPLDACREEMVTLILQAAAVALSRQLKIQNLRAAAVIDPLTGCYNRREFENQLRRSLSGAVRHQTKLSVFMFDLDHFKTVNDTYGHPAGDQVLRQISALVKQNMRSGDILARYGGEEFIAILPETDKIKAMELADRLRVIISGKQISFGQDHIRITASFGVAEMDPQASMEKIIQDADAMLYKAKLSGRNTVMPGIIKLVPVDDRDILSKSVN